MICLDTRTTVLACPQLCTSSLKILPDRSCMYYSHSQGLNYFVQLAGNPMPCYHYICQKSSIQIILSSLLVYDTGCWCRGPERRHAQWPNLTAHRLAPTTTQAWPLGVRSDQWTLAPMDHAEPWQYNPHEFLVAFLGNPFDFRPARLSSRKMWSEQR